MTETHQENLFAHPLGTVPSFVFDKAVVDVFPDMIRRSVPGYETILAHCGELASRYVQSGSHCYDLGCSLGASTLAMRSRIEDHHNTKIIAVDNSAAMLNKCATMLASVPSTISTELLNQDICDTKIENASMVVMNFTLQFIPMPQRVPLLEKIYAGLNPGGCLVISEKLHFVLDNFENYFRRRNQTKIRSLDQISNFKRKKRYFYFFLGSATGKKISGFVRNF